VGELLRDVLNVERTEFDESKRAGQEAFNLGRRLLWGIKPKSESVPIDDPGGDDFRIIRPRTRYLDLREEGELVLSDTIQTYKAPRVSEENISVEIRGMDSRAQWFRDHVRPEGELLFSLDVEGVVNAGMRNVFDGHRALEIIRMFGDPSLPIPQEQLGSSK
jgi:hypothetical protein